MNSSFVSRSYRFGGGGVFLVFASPSLGQAPAESPTLQAMLAEIRQLLRTSKLRHRRNGRTSSSTVYTYKEPPLPVLPSAG